MKCRDCKFRTKEVRAICDNQASDNYTDYVAAELECKDGEKDEQRDSN